MLPTLCLVVTSAWADSPHSATDRPEPSVAVPDAPLPEPVVLIHGFDSSPELWRGTRAILAVEGYAPLVLNWQPEAGKGAAETASSVILPRVEQALREAHYPPDSPFHLVTHSLGGLLARFLLEQPAADTAGWRDRVRSLVMLSTPHHGARTGLAALACRHYSKRAWRELGCDMRPRSVFLQSLGTSKPAGLTVAYLSVGVESPAPFLLVPLFDGDGDGCPRGHDNTVMAESAYLDGAGYALWRGWDRSDHFTASCSRVVNRWIVEFLREHKVPVASARRVRGGDACRGLSGDSGAADAR